jgi:ubiquitin-conjugating enzyme E2 S
VLSADFPSTPPRGYFLTKIYHPNVDPTTGAICVNTLKSDWTPSTTIGHVLTVIRCLLIVPFPESSLNDEAGRNFMDSYDEYARRARLLAGVHGLTGWSTGGEGGSDETTESGGEEDGGDEKATANPAESRKSVYCSNMVRVGSKTLDKKSKKKSLRRL